MKYKFLGLQPAKDKIHKYIATFINLETNRKKTVRFGAYSMNDYIIYNKTQGKEEADKHKERYIKRHANDNLKDPVSPGSLSMYLLWDQPTLEASLSNYLKRFKDQIS